MWWLVCWWSGDISVVVVLVSGEMPWTGDPFHLQSLMLVSGVLSSGGDSRKPNPVGIWMGKRFLLDFVVASCRSFRCLKVGRHSSVLQSSMMVWMVCLSGGDGTEKKSSVGQDLFFFLLACWASDLGG